jgi:murein L,D-transpeptidase YafK
MKQFISLFAIIFIVSSGSAQTAASNFAFIDYQRSFPRINEALKRKEDTLRRQFDEKKLQWPAKYIYLRSFKYDSQLEVWVKGEKDEKYRLFKSYKVCALAGTLGPKRMQGDYQVPEGFYYINEFKPNSNYHLALGLNYPNSSDRILSDSIQPGGDIYIHGKCVTTGCIPITDGQIEELYILTAYARNQGQDFIPVHIFPVNFSNQKSVAYLNKYLKDFPEYTELADELKHAYWYFDKVKQLPVIMVGSNGEYMVEGVIPEEKPAAPVKKKLPRPTTPIDEKELAKVVEKLPVYPGGNEAFREFLNKVSREAAAHLPKEQQRTYVMIEYIIDKEGNPINAKVLKGGNEEMNEELEIKFEKMPKWTPAIHQGKTVPIKLKQSLEVEKK